VTGDFRLSDELPALLRATRTVVPATGLGVLALDGDRHAVLRYATTYGVHAHRIAIADLPSMLQPPWLSARVVTAAELEAEAGNRVVDRLLWVGMPEEVRQVFGLRQFVATPLAGVEPAALLITGINHADTITPGQLDGCGGIANQAAEAAQQPETVEAEVSRLRRLETVDALLPALFSVLDVRQIFETTSRVTNALLPHDLVALGLFNSTLTDVTVYAHTSPTGLPQRLSNRYPLGIAAGWLFHIQHDLANHPLESDQPPALAGMRSSMNVAIRTDDRLIGGLSFFSTAAGRYTRDDIAVARRIADYVGLALSHNRLADEARRAEALKEREANLQLLDGLLGTLTGVLDVRQVFGKVCEIAKSVLPHDAVGLPLIDEDREHVLTYAASEGMPSLPGRMPLPPHMRYLFDGEPWDYEIYEDVKEHPNPRTDVYGTWGFRSFIRVPVLMDGRTEGFLVFFSREPHVYAKEHVLLARRIADHVTLALSHQRLAEEARRREAIKDRVDKLEMLDELLTVVTGAGELPQVWDRISDVAQKVVPHDALILTALLPGGLKARVYAAKVPGESTFGDIVEVPPYMLEYPDWQYELVDDLRTRENSRHLEAVKRGYRAALRVAIRLDGQYVAGVSFLSFQPNTYVPAHVPVGRRIADRLSFSFARERSKALAVKADEAAERAARLESRVKALTDELDARSGYRRVIGNSAHWKRVLTQATQVGPTETTALLLGESGTGKEVVARFIHRASSRSHGPFVALNCAALPEHLLEAELFGFERGAFTGATQTKPGQLEQAAGGTLFLDEVGEMSPPAQAKFLRVLQEREFQRLGGTRVLRADVRVVAATNRDLERAIAQGTFREDLFYRLNVFAIHLPPLRDRVEDVLPLSESFLAEYARSMGRPPSGISREARQLLLDYHWPGNVRELRNILERAAILCEGGLITTEHLSLNVRPRTAAPITIVSAPPSAPVPSSPTPKRPDGGGIAAPPPASPSSPVVASDLQEMERTMVEQALAQARFNKSKAAKALGLTRAQLYVRMKRYGLE
jgi:transcriptional regulator with GAF, ATPase, and Fis domain